MKGFFMFLFCWLILIFIFSGDIRAEWCRIDHINIVAATKTVNCVWDSCYVKCSYAGQSDVLEDTCFCDWDSYSQCTMLSTSCSGTGGAWRACCDQAHSWHKYSSSCNYSSNCTASYNVWYCYYSYTSYTLGGSVTRTYNTFDKLNFSLSCNAYWSSTMTCSLRDKCVSGTVRPGLSTCGSYGGEYKYCCTEDGVKHTCVGYDEDGLDPLEFSYCTGGSTLKNDPCCPKINGACGVLADSQGLVLTASTPGLCTDGSIVSDFRIAGTYYRWTCLGNDDTCTIWTTTDQDCSALYDTVPVWKNMTNYKNDPPTSLVAWDSGSRNQWCKFRDNNFVVFKVGVSDAQGLSDIKDVTLNLKNNNGTIVKSYGPTTVDANGYAYFKVGNVGGTDNRPADGIYSLWMEMTDQTDGVGVGSTDTGYDFKFWDCQVSVTGMGYDNSAGVACSTSNNYTTPLSSDLDYGLTFTNFSSGVSIPVTVNSPTYSEVNLDWGDDYRFNVSNLPGTDPTGLRITDIGLSTVKCFGGIQFNIGSDALVSAYNNPVAMKVDFDSILDQDSWFQTRGGGLMSYRSIYNYVPVTCSGLCTPAMSMAGSYGSQSLVAFGEDSDDVSDSNSSDTDKWVAANLVSENYSYQDFYNKFFVTLGEGITASGSVNSSLIVGNGLAGLFLIDGDLNIENRISVASDDYLMVIASGNITIDSSVDQVDGIYIGDNINIGGSSSSQLIVNGMLYGNDGVNITRTFGVKSQNNTSPAVVIDYRPSFVFKMPGKLIEALSKWRMD